MTTQLRAVELRRIRTDRLEMAVRTTGTGEQAVVFVHGNCSSSRFFERLLERLPDHVLGLAPDNRGFGDTEPLEIDATRGMRDLSDDLAGLLATLGIDRAVFVAHSAGAGVVLQLTIEHPELVAGLVLEAPMSPYGFGGTRGLDGTPCFDDHAASGGGTANPEFVAGLASGDRSLDSPTSPRNVLRSFYVKPTGGELPDEEGLLDSVLSTRVGDGHYPGTLTPSDNWPGVAPGETGMNNAFSPRWFDVSGIVGVTPKPPVLWVRGADDAIVSDTSMFDLGYLGQLGAVPGWPGDEVLPPQPMVGQMRAVLDRYAANGGNYDEVVFEDTGHSPHLEQPDRFLALLLDHLDGAR
jgi:pimeloyl-ACP methyl ester carboxylesterase